MPAQTRPILRKTRSFKWPTILFAQIDEYADELGMSVNAAAAQLIRDGLATHKRSTS